MSLFQKKFQAVGLQLYLESVSCKSFFCDIFKTLQNSFFIVHTWIAASDLIEYMETLTVNEDLRKCLTVLTIIIDFTENIWDFGVAMKQSENCI